MMAKQEYYRHQTYIRVLHKIWFLLLITYASIYSLFRNEKHLPNILQFGLILFGDTVVDYIFLYICTVFVLPSPVYFLFPFGNYCEISLMLIGST